ncbi:aldehyde dehydrogenase family protein [Streptomyces sp. NBC_00237]|uniref:aldehyde dehydrogenase family protein n=1 Tax=Streptomyces sp. NBC_00237 TaxID=2975687 RepID=UPI00224F0C4D|nr:aldehyde dehydrogenase family protein [Streptomyces sp. NBC_00237]MCX5205050.1 aldehyde dehydrogenase family protein [Streptomyces sp. NBC_00237]
MSVLTRVATHQAARDEFFRSLRVLAGAPWELSRTVPGRLGRLATFLPSNNLLYSYVLFGVVPSLYTDRVLIRPSARVAETAMAVHEILGPAVREWGGNIDMRRVSQREFLDECALSDAVVFTGQPDNAEHVARRLPRESLLLSFGSGPNPVVLGPDSDLDTVCRTVLDARLYNSGQDCLCSDIVFVHRSIAHEVTSRLADSLRTVAVADRRDPRTRVSALVYPDAVADADSFLTEHREFVVVGGGTDVARNIVEPTLLHMPWNGSFHPPEFFSPVLLTMEYEDPAQIVEWLHTPEERERGMYVSTFGEPGLSGPRIATSTVCENQITFDVEDGNRPFGGHGPRAGNVRRSGEIQARPLLLSAEAARAGRGPVVRPRP